MTARSIKWKIKMETLHVAESILARLRDCGYEAYLAGGCVRDKLLGAVPTDYDVATSATPEEVCRIFRRTKKVGAQFGVVIVVLKNTEIEVATFRTDCSYKDGRRPEAVRFSSPEEDARRRDFTINGMFYDPANDRIIDYVGGRDDLDAQIVRCIGEPERRFEEDHLRMLRAVRFAARLGFSIEDSTMRAIGANAQRITEISAERIRMELELILTNPNRVRAWQLLRGTRLLNYLSPSMSLTDEQANLVENILGHLPADITVCQAFAVMLLSLPDESIKNACVGLRCSNDTTEGVRFLASNSGVASKADSLDLADIKVLLNTGLFNDLLVVASALAQAEGTGERELQNLSRRSSRIAPEAIAPRPLITGDDLMRFGLSPGPQFGKILSRVYREQLNEEILSREMALARAKILISWFEGDPTGPSLEYGPQPDPT